MYGGRRVHMWYRACALHAYQSHRGVHRARANGVTRMHAETHQPSADCGCSHNHYVHGILSLFLSLCPRRTCYIRGNDSASVTSFRADGISSNKVSACYQKPVRCYGSITGGHRKNRRSMEKAVHEYVVLSRVLLSRMKSGRY